jgi:Sulfotransferase domain
MEDCNTQNFQGTTAPSWGFWEGNDLRYHNHSETWLSDWTRRLPWTDGIHNITVDKSPSNLNTLKHPEIPRMAKELLPNAKIVATLCKPSTRMFSEFEYHMVPKRHYHLENEFEKFGRKTPDNFVDFAHANLACLKLAEQKYEKEPESEEYCEQLLNDYLRIGEYVRHLQPWYEQYGEQNVLVLDMEQDSESKVSALLSHVGEDILPPEEYPWHELEDNGSEDGEFFTNENYQGRDSIFQEHPGVIGRLEVHFAPFNEALAVMIGDDFPLSWNNRTAEDEDD